MLEKLSIRDALTARGVIMYPHGSCCPLCFDFEESTDHLLFYAGVRRSFSLRSSAGWVFPYLFCRLELITFVIMHGKSLTEGNRVNSITVLDGDHLMYLDTYELCSV